LWGEPLRAQKKPPSEAFFVACVGLFAVRYSLIPAPLLRIGLVRLPLTRTSGALRGCAPLLSLSLLGFAVGRTFLLAKHKKSVNILFINKFI
jgi:hypothetical protein